MKVRGAPDEEREPTKEERAKIEKWLRMLHCRSGHASMLNIAEGLRRRGADAVVIRIAKSLKCDACEASSLPPPRPFVGFEPPPQKYEICESDFGEWKHPITGITTKFQVNVDVKTRL